MLRQKGFTGFFGRQMYAQLVPANHFLRKVDELVDWLPVIRKLTPAYKGQFSLGASALNPVTVFKMLFLSYLYDRSEREIEVMCNESIPCKYFIEIGIDESAPDHSTLSRFRERIINHTGDTRVFEAVFAEILLQIFTAGLQPGNVQIIDSKHMNARVSQYRKTGKSPEQQQKEQADAERRQGAGKKPKDKRLKQEIDPEAGIGCKGTEKKPDAKGNLVEMKKWFYGYKMNCSIENKNDLITSCILSSGNAADGSFFEPLFWKDVERRGLADIYAADKGYDWGDHHLLLNWLEVGDAICLNDYRLKDDKLHALWHKIAGAEAYQQGKQERYKVERTNGDMFNNLGIHHCRYYGKAKTAIQMFMTAIAYNIRKAMKVLYGISVREPVRAVLPARCA